MRQWSVSLVQTLPLLCVPQRGLIFLLQSDIGYVSMPQISRFWPSPTPRLSSRSPNAPSTGPTEPNRRTLCSGIHHVILTAIEPSFYPRNSWVAQFIVCVAGRERATAAFILSTHSTSYRTEPDPDCVCMCLQPFTVRKRGHYRAEGFEAVRGEFL